MTTETKLAIEQEIEDIITQFRALPVPAKCWDCDDDDLYQENLEYRWHRDEQQNRLDELREQLNLERIIL